jgi:hypothetical protein
MKLVNHEYNTVRIFFNQKQKQKNDKDDRGGPSI